MFVMWMEPLWVKKIQNTLSKLKKYLNEKLRNKYK